MTQTNTTTTVFRAWGKDRLSDPWTCFEARFRWQADRWLTERAFVQRDWHGSPLIAEGAPEGRSRIEWRVNGAWQPYTAWVGPESRARQIEWITAEHGRGTTQTFRIVIEGEPLVLVGLI